MKHRKKKYEEILKQCNSAAASAQLPKMPVLSMAGQWRGSSRRTAATNDEHGCKCSFRFT